MKNFADFSTFKLISLRHNKQNVMITRIHYCSSKAAYTSHYVLHAQRVKILDEQIFFRPKQHVTKCVFLLAIALMLILSFILERN